MSERLADETAGRLFPVNALRNLALLAAQTELVMLASIFDMCTPPCRF